MFQFFRKHLFPIPRAPLHELLKHIRNMNEADDPGDAESIQNLLKPICDEPKKEIPKISTILLRNLSSNEISSTPINKNLANQKISCHLCSLKITVLKFPEHCKVVHGKACHITVKPQDTSVVNFEYKNDTKTKSANTKEIGKNDDTIKKVPPKTSENAQNLEELSNEKKIRENIKSQEICQDSDETCQFCDRSFKSSVLKLHMKELHNIADGN